MTLAEATIGQEYVVLSVQTQDEEVERFLFTLGCYEGEPVTVVSHMSRGYVVSIKEGRYTFDKNLASTVMIV